MSPASAAIIKVGGACTLIRAVVAANNDTTATGHCTQGRAADTIVLPARTVFPLATVNNTSYGPSGLPPIRTSITILGNGSTIRRVPRAPNFNVFLVGETGALTLQNTIVSGGGSTGGVISANGIRNFGGVTKVSRSTISGNGNCGVENFHELRDTPGDIRFVGRVTIDKSVISGNGCGVSASYSASFLVRYTTISHNRFGGGFTDNNNLRIVNSTISGNGGSGVYAYTGSATIIHSTITGNVGAKNSDEFTRTRGGGIYVGYQSNVSLTNSTVSGNSATQGGGLWNSGNNSFVAVTNSTITRNTAIQGGGLYADRGYGTVKLTRSIISGNAATEAREAAVDSNSSYLTVGNFNIFGNSGVSGISGFTPGITDIVPAQPLGAILTPTLAKNGGSTRTHALVAGSVAIDAVNDGTCPPPATDQRGVKRPRDGNGDGGPACDIGAYEF